MTSAAPTRSVLVTELPQTASSSFSMAGTSAVQRANLAPNHAELAASRIPRVVAVPKPAKDVERFLAKQRWEGVVTSVTGDSFVAELRNQTDTTAPLEVAEILRAELSADDVPLLKPGAVFYWSIGYHVTKFGQQTKQSSIRFRRLPAWIAADLSAARDEARQWAHAFGETSVNESAG